MPQAVICRAYIWEDAACTCMARVLGHDGVAITIATLTSITCKVFNLEASDPTVVVLQPSVVVATSIFDTLQLDARWSIDAVGYNFRFTVPAAAFATPGRHRIEFFCDPVTGENFPIVYEPMALWVLSS